MLIEPDWKNAGGQHMWDSHQITPVEANEAVNDVDAVWFDPDPKSKSGQSVRVIGWSPTADSVLTVILVHTEDGEGWYGATRGHLTRRTGGSTTRSDRASLRHLLGRDNTTMNEQTQKLILAEIEESELTRNDPTPDGAVGVRRNRDRAQVYSVRLAPDVVRQIEQIATENDVPASSVVRGFIVAGLQQCGRGSETVGASVDRLSSEVERLRGLLR